MRSNNSTNLWSQSIERITGAIDALARRRTMTVALVGVVSFIAAAIVGLSRDFPPAPTIHDEFSLLLAADTYTQGRLSNPPHPMSKFFDTMHVLQHPTYMSKYPPIQGLMLALGKMLTGHYIVGAWISCGILCAAVCWMLQGYLPPRWALYGAVISAYQVGFLSEWSQSYWGSSMAAAGGAVLLGAVARIWRKPRWRHCTLLCLGLLILANTRPYEGLAVASLPILALAVACWRRQGVWRRELIRRGILSAVATFPIGLAAMAYNNHAITLNPLRLPYQLHNEQYMTVPVFMFQRPPGGERAYSHDTLRAFHDGWEKESYLFQRSLAGYMRYRAKGFKDKWQFYLGWILTLPMVVGLFCCRRKDRAMALISLGAVIGATLVATWSAERSLSPATAVVMLLVTLGLRKLAAIAPWRSMQHALPCLVILLLPMFHPMSPVRAFMMTHDRDRVIATLNAQPGKDLVFVRVSPKSNIHCEWVYNGADIDGQSVVFARYFDPIENARLIDYYPDRKAWTVEIGEWDQPVRLRPYGD